MLTRWGTRSPPTSAALTKCVMPKRSPHAFFSGLTSTPMIIAAPTSRSPWMTFKPMPPRPNTTHFAPGSTFAVLITAPMPVVTPQPIVTHLVEGGVFADFCHGDFGQDGEIREGGTAHVMMNFLAAD